MNEKTIDKYKLLSTDLLGAGSFAKVYKGIDTTNNRQVAIKMLPKKNILNDKYLMEGLRRELSVMQKLKGNNVVRLLDTLESQNNYYIVQEYCKDGDLGTYLKKQQYLTEVGAIRILTDILNGFIELLQQGIIHRDLKPANILVHQNTFKLGDFGFAKCISNFQRDIMESVVGTPLYMAPQILMRESYTSKCDIWSIGCIFYECIFRRTPWIANSVPQLLNMILKCPVQFPSYISAEAKDFIQKCLEVEEDKRMGWNDLYRHQLIYPKFKDHVDKVINMEAQAEFIINELRQIIVVKQIDLLETFKKLQIQDNQFLTFKELQLLLNEIDPKLNRQQIEFVFNMIDVDMTNQINFLEFQRCLQQHRVRLSLQEIKPDIVYENSPLIQIPKWKIELKKIKDTIEEEQKSLVKLFKQFDTDINQVLDLVEFVKFLRFFNSKINNEDASLIFQYFDKNCNGGIDFLEFKSTFESQIQ
ncbi:unnamed protein product [Paramecium pentaurelia]|uniref:Calcium-dependent protein kinase n=1 Tax=Paramecium pentaurelia TaxID=43138 RepID=A0A8S1YGG4_9CILI|nr:unnamed protein product [Paramecium pentaurelia]